MNVVMMTSLPAAYCSTFLPLRRKKLDRQWGRTGVSQQDPSSCPLVMDGVKAWCFRPIEKNKRETFLFLKKQIKSVQYFPLLLKNHPKGLKINLAPALFFLSASLNIRKAKWTNTVILNIGWYWGILNSGASVPLKPITQTHP